MNDCIVYSLYCVQALHYMLLYCYVAPPPPLSSTVAVQLTSPSNS